MVMKIKEIRNLSAEQREERLARCRKELMDTRAQLSAGGSINDPTRIKSLKKNIARMMTVKREEEIENQ